MLNAAGAGPDRAAGALEPLTGEPDPDGTGRAVAPAAADPAVALAAADPAAAEPDAEAAALARGAAEVLPAGGLSERVRAARAEGRPLRVKFGIDPSATELTLGHAVVLRRLRAFQDAGHVAVLIVGDFTGRVGDPSGRSRLRPELSAAETARHAASYLDQVLRVLDPDPHRLEVRRNSEWLAPMTMSDVIAQARALTVARLLEREDFARRFAAREPISLVEFLYPMLQGIDSVAVRADVELGGTDQTYNLLVGRDLQRLHGQPPQVVLTVPLLEGLDGAVKMSKSMGNFVAITEPAAEQFGKLMSVPDTVVARYALLCTDLPAQEVAEIAAAARAGGPAAAAAKRRMAEAVVTLYHGPGAARQARERFDTLFRARATPADLPVHDLPASDPVHLPTLLVAAGLAASTSAARRLLRDGAVRLNGRPLAADTLDLPRDHLVGAVLSAGRRHLVRLGPGPGTPR